MAPHLERESSVTKAILRASTPIVADYRRSGTRKAFVFVEPREDVSKPRLPVDFVRLNPVRSGQHLRRP